MLQEMSVLWATLGTMSGSLIDAGIAFLTSSSRVAPDRLVVALDELPRYADDFAKRCFRWVPATGWVDVAVAPYTPRKPDHR